MIGCKGGISAPESNSKVTKQMLRRREVGVGRVDTLTSILLQVQYTSTLLSAGTLETSVPDFAVFWNDVLSLFVGEAQM